MNRKMKRRSMLISLGIIACALAITYAPVPGLQQTVVVVSGSELQDPLAELEQRFEAQNPGIQLEVRIQGSQDMVNNYLDDRNDVDPTVLIPASGELLNELSDRWQAQNGDEPFYEPPRPVAQTVLVGIAWPERGDVLFPGGRFQWDQLKSALEASTWGEIGGDPAWGSFDFVMTDPTRSSSGQLTMTLLAQSVLGSPPTPANLSNPAVQELTELVRRSVYNPPRSTDIMLQEFITRGPNDADVATVYESIALHRWEEASATQGKPYQIYYLDPTIETTSTAAIVRRNVDRGTADAARQFIDFLLEPEQQATFVQYGFRPATPGIDLASVPNSPWSQNIPGAEVNLPGQVQPPPEPPTIAEIVRLWQRAN
jgi:ABC-type molybdate transport system substrate-binding protein